MPYGQDCGKQDPNKQPAVVTSGEVGVGDVATPQDGFQGEE